MLKPLEASFVTLILSPWHLIFYTEICNLEWNQWKSLCFDWRTYGNLMFRHISPATKQSFHQRIFTLSYWQSHTWCIRQDRKKKREGEGGTKGEKINLHDTSFKSASSTMHILGAGQHRGQGWAPTEPRHHRVNPRYTSTGSGQVHMEDGVKGIGRVYSPGAYRLWSQAEFRFCLYSLVVLCPLQVT